MTLKKIYYITHNENYIEIKEGYLIEIFKDAYGYEMATVRECIEKCRPEHFHDIPLYNIKEFVESNEIDFLNDISNRIHERIDDLFCELKDIESERNE